MEFRSHRNCSWAGNSSSCSQKRSSTGKNGSTGSTAGGQSYTYEDIEATLHKNIVAAGLRVLRL